MANGLGRRAIGSIVTPRWKAALALLSLASGAIAGPCSVVAGPWQSLLDAETAPAWHGWRSPGLPAGWQIHGGILSKQGEVEDLVSVREYASFELQLDWKVGTGANSGIFYRATREYDRLYWSGPEYQLLDDTATAEETGRLTAAGAAYGVYGPPRRWSLASGRWNRSRLVLRGTHVEHWLNGHRVVAYQLLSDDWRARVQAGKFSAYPHYGTAPRGVLGIQGDHQGDLAIRSLRIREIPECP